MTGPGRRGRYFSVNQLKKSVEEGQPWKEKTLLTMLGHGWCSVNVINTEWSLTGRRSHNLQEYVVWRKSVGTSAQNHEAFYRCSTNNCYLDQARSDKCSSKQVLSPSREIEPGALGLGWSWPELPGADVPPGCYLCSGPGYNKAMPSL